MRRYEYLNSWNICSYLSSSQSNYFRQNRILLKLFGTRLFSACIWHYNGKWPEICQDHFWASPGLHPIQRMTMQMTWTCWFTKEMHFLYGYNLKNVNQAKTSCFFLNVHQLETSLKLILFQSLNLSMDFEIENLLHTLTHHFQWQWHWVKHSYCSSLNWRENFTAAACTSLSLWCTEKFERSLLDQNPLCLLRQLLRYATKAQQTDKIRDEEATLQDDCRQVSEGSRGKNSFPKT